MKTMAPGAYFSPGGITWHLFGMKWDGPNEPPELDKIRKRLKGIPKKSIGEKRRKIYGGRIHGNTQVKEENQEMMTLGRDSVPAFLS